MRRRLIAGNWKMNAPADVPGLVDAVAKASGEHPDLDALICPPALLIPSLAKSGVNIGAQDCHTALSGAHTGDLSAEMLAQAGASHVIVGHSERRAAYGESNLTVRDKATAAHKAGLTAIICVGETAAERAEGRASQIVTEQIRTALTTEATADNTIIAYEPVWAIGSGNAATTAEIAEMHAVIRAEIGASLGDATSKAMRILYGGSMNAANAADILALEDVDGGLVGGASLKIQDFLSIIAA